MPGHVDVQSVEELRAQRGRSHGRRGDPEPHRGAAARGRRGREPGPRDIVFEGSFDEVNRFFYENEWSDGLPIVPPTRERVERVPALHATAPRTTSSACCCPTSARATVWSVAVNGVMAGCRPEYMPILVALVEAMADPRYGVEHSGNTPGAETLIILNGPIIKELGFNYEQGVLRDGFQANTTVGRFWRLYLRNVAGFLPPQDRQGHLRQHVARRAGRERGRARAASAGPTIAADDGLRRGDNAVTISRYTGGGVIASVFGSTPEQMLAVPRRLRVAARSAGSSIFTVGHGRAAR